MSDYWLKPSKSPLFWGMLVGALALCALLLSQAAQAQDTAGQESKAAPDATSASYGAWTLHCLKAAETQARCEISQALTLKGQGEAQGKSTLIGQIALGHKDAEGPLVLALRLPGGVYLPANIDLIEASGQKITAQYQICTQFCLAETEPTPEFIAALKTPGAALQIKLQDGGRRPVEIALDLNGFNAAFEALEAN